jgi:putative membrane protein
MAWLAEHYLWLKALHLIAVISWMAGLLYLPRLFVYHCSAAPGSETSETFKVMEHRLARYIMTPAMVVSLLVGLCMLGANPGLLRDGSMHAKLLFIVFLIGIHFMMLGWKNAFAEDRNQKSERYFRVANEVPTLLMIGIVILIVVKPF